MSNPLAWPRPTHGETAAFSHLKRTRQQVDLHSHADHQLIVPVHGRLVFRVRDAREAVQAPQALFLTAGTAHALEAPSGEVDLFALQLSDAALKEAAKLLGAAWQPPPGGYGRLERVTPLLRELIHQLLFQSDAEGDAASMTYAYLCLTLVDRLTREQTPKVEAPTTFRSEYVDRAVAHLKANLTDAVSLPELSRRVGTSPRHLTREFQKELGVSPVRYASRLRLEEAARRLWNTDAAVKDIALTLGFVSVPRFNTAFRAFKGCTPLEHRAKRP